MISATARPTANPVVVLREDFDGWAVLYNPDTDEAFGINAIGAALWRSLDGHLGAEELFSIVLRNFRDNPTDATDHLRGLLIQMNEAGLVVIEEGFEK